MDLPWTSTIELFAARKILAFCVFEYQAVNSGRRFVKFERYGLTFEDEGRSVKRYVTSYYGVPATVRKIFEIKRCGHTDRWITEIQIV